MMIIFASMLYERRIIFTSKRLSRLSACVQAANAVLYPMNWQHIFIPVLPVALVDYLLAPMPFLIGVPTPVLQVWNYNGFIKSIELCTQAVCFSSVTAGTCFFCIEISTFYRYFLGYEVPMSKSPLSPKLSKTSIYTPGTRVKSWANKLFVHYFLSLKILYKLKQQKTDIPVY